MWAALISVWQVLRLHFSSIFFKPTNPRLRTQNQLKRNPWNQNKPERQMKSWKSTTYLQINLKNFVYIHLVKEIGSVHWLMFRVWTRNIIKYWSTYDEAAFLELFYFNLLWVWGSYYPTEICQKFFKKGYSFQLRKTPKAGYGLSLKTQRNTLWN